MMNQRGRPPKRLVKGQGIVMVVDDEPIMRKIASNVLEKSGYEVIVAENGDQAIELFKQHHNEIRAVLLDLLMPQKSGKETYLEMKQIQPDVNVILITGAIKDKRIDEVLELGVKGYLEKPYTYPQLSRAVFNLIGKSKPDTSSRKK
ncbi:MAG: response regulator [Candidatus Omnitrophota bacterium]